MSSGAWQNLALAALFVFYVIQIGLDVLWHNLCGHLAIDYCSFWSAGYLADTKGYVSVYDLHLMEEIQRSIFPDLAAVTPTPFLPVFIIPFQLFALIRPPLGFCLWAILNLAVLFFYLRFFARRTGDQPVTMHSLALLFLSLPVFINLFTGQVNVWLAICIGEFIRAVMTRRPFRAGLWLGGLLLKPQLLILLLLALIIQRSIKILAGFAASSAILIGLSTALAGVDGMQKLIGLWLGYVRGLPTNDVEIMMNWRMVGLHLSAFTDPAFGWAVAGFGSTITLLGTLYLWRRKIDFQQSTLISALLGTLAATGLIAWHAHIHTAMILIPPLIYLHQHRQLSGKILQSWVFFPSAVYLAVFIFAAFVQANILPTRINALLNFSRGASEFGMNLFLFLWALKRPAGQAGRSEL